MNLKEMLKLFFAIFVCEAVGFVGSIFTVSSISTWYEFLVKPEFAPPNWVFGPVWTALYALMGIAAYLVWRNIESKPKETRQGLRLFVSQLLLNGMWSPIFFGLQNPGLAYFVIVLLWVAIAGTIFAFAKISRTATLLMVPYFLWVTFASFLNYYIWILN